MNELETMLATFVGRAKTAMKAGNFAEAAEQLVHARKCALLLAKSTTGAERDRHMATAASLKELYEQAVAKSGAAAPAEDTR